MAWWPRWLPRSLTARDRGLYESFGGSDTWAGEHVSPEGALNLSAFWAATRVKAQTVASLSLEVFEVQSDGTRVRVPSHPLSMILHDSPNADQTPLEFWAGRVLGLCTRGNGFAEKRFNSRGSLVSLNAMPADTAVERRESGLWYTFHDRGKTVSLPEEKVLHIRAFGDGDVGMSPVEYARQTLGIAIASERAAGQVFSKGLRTKGFFTFPGTLTPDQRDQARKNFADRYSAPNAPGIGILEAGVDFKPVNITPKDAELILSRRFNVEEICRWMGVPPILIGHSAEGQTMWGTGIEQIMQGWLTLSLRSELKNIEQAVFKRVFTPAERLRYRVKFNVEDLLRGDSTKRSAFYVALLNAGVMTINEVRRLEGLPPVEGGDVPRMQMQNVPITEAAGGLPRESANVDS
ncbi:phage portal protein [Roseomonas xinghualingensis]|uniref:phage portal protein n=1 Tax=Roseomonas xinghualingensis TaxID=2986475 RepID=UPI0021F11957|nr:phage portal protein [Roseomonas sp. SXEYE001]MCV4209981.1 phage portal protein [Roseomonas sp. SXEYE001]